MSVEENNFKNNNQASKIAQRYLEVKSFYSKHFPTDRRTYNLRVPFVGLILSILSLIFVTSLLWRYVRDDGWIHYYYIFVATGVSYELYYGLKIGDRKQYTPWIIFKFIEVCLTFAAVIYGIYDNWHFISEYVGWMIYGIIVLALNIRITYVIFSKSLKQFRGSPQVIIDENIYDNYDNV